MEANVWPIGQVFNRGGDVHYALPRFQRAYAWKKPQWRTLWEDFLNLHKDENAFSEHFLGVMVVIPETAHDSHTPIYNVVDGQQRLITISILLLALADYTGDEAYRQKAQRFLVNEYEQGDLRFKVWPTEHNDDRNAWKLMVNTRNPAQENRSLIPEARNFFHDAIVEEDTKNGISPEKMFQSLMKRFSIVFITLNLDERPHQIFESLNAKGLDLTQVDLVRNYLAMKLPAQKQDNAWEEHWMPIQNMFGTQRPGDISEFLLHYLVCKTGVWCKEDEVFEHFRKRMDLYFYKQQDCVSEVKNMHRHAKYYLCLLQPCLEQDKDLQRLLENSKALDRTVMRPLLLYLYDAGHKGHISRDDLIRDLSLIENFLTRHFLAGRPTSTLRSLCASLVRVESMEDLRERLLDRYYPNDKELCDVQLANDVYRAAASRKRLTSILLRVNEDLMKGRDVIISLEDAPTIEHILPRNPNKDWEQHLGKNWEDSKTREQLLLHRLGNLTLVTQSWNSSMSNRSWHKKRTLLCEHGLPLNHQYFGEGNPGDLMSWTESAIMDRGQWLINILLKLWPNLNNNRRKVTYDPERHPRRSVNYTNSGITSFTLHGDTKSVTRNSWNNAAQQFTNLVAVHRPNFDEIAAQLPERLSNTSGDLELMNGWWINRMGANDAARFLGELAELCELDDTDWSISVKFYDSSKSSTRAGSE